METLGIGHANCGSSGQGEEGRQRPVSPGLGMIGSGGFVLQEELKKMGVGSAMHLIILPFVVTERALLRQ